jgi:hypothetical protein
MDPLLLLLLFSRILVTRQVINVDLLDIHQVEILLVLTHSYCNYNTS